ncbi:MAG: ribosome maturation factor RimM [Caldimonas sp.]
MADAAWPADALEVGRIGDAWGLKGWFRVQPYASPPETLLAARRWHLRPASPGPAPGRSWSAGATFLDIREVREHGDGLVAAAGGVDDRSAAEALRGARIFIARSSFPKAGIDEFYWADLIGLAVVNRDGVALGKVAGLIDTGPHSVLRVLPDGAAELPAAEERLIPFVSAYVDSVDLAGRSIVVDWGLDY